MAKTISQRIALEGGDEIKRQLEDMGKAGTIAADQMGAAFLAASQELDKFVSKIRNVEVAFAAVSKSAAGVGQGIANFGAAFTKFESAISRTLRNTALFGAAVGGAVFVVGKLIKSSFDAADAVGEEAASLGISTDAFQGLSAAAADSGIEQEQFGRALSNLNKIIKDAAIEQAAQSLGKMGRVFAPTAQGAEAAARAVGQLSNGVSDIAALGDTSTNVLSRLGISVRDFRGNIKGADDVLFEIADALNKLPDGSVKSALALEAFGKRGRNFVDLLSRGGEGLREFTAQFRALSLSEREISIGDQVARSLLILETRLDAARNKLVLLFAPSVGSLADAFSKKILDNFENLRAGLFNVVQNGVEPAIRDLVRLINGDDANVETQWIIDARERLRSFGNGARQVGVILLAVFEGIRAASGAAAKAINALFGSNIGGGSLSFALFAAAILRITGLLGLMTAGINLAAASLRVLIQAFGLAARAAVAFGAVLTLITAFNPALGAITAFAVGFAAVFTLTSETVQNIWTRMWDQLDQTTKVRAIQLAASAVEGLIDGISALIRTPIGGGEPIVKFLFGDIKTQMQSVQAQAIEAMKRLAETTAQQTPQNLGFIDKIKQLFTEGFGDEALKKQIRDLDEQSKKLGQTGTNTFNDLAQGANKLASGVGNAASQVSKFGNRFEQLAKKPLAEQTDLEFTELFNTKFGGTEIAGRDFPAAPSQERVQQATGPLAQLGGSIQQLGLSATTALDPIARLGNTVKVIQNPFAIPLPQPRPAAAGTGQPAAATDTATHGIQALGQAATQTAGEVDLAGASFQGADASTSELDSAIAQAAQSLQTTGPEVSSLGDAANEIQASFFQLAPAADKAADALDDIETPSGGGLARGGQVWGAGTSTSDSILARLSRGEFVVNARQTRRWLGVLSAINSGRFRMPKFALGGLVDNFNRSLMSMSFPAFADGGVVEAQPVRTPITLVMPDGRRIGGLSATDDAVATIKKSAAIGQVASGGRKPSWVR